MESKPKHKWTLLQFKWGEQWRHYHPDCEACRQLGGKPKQAEIEHNDH